MIFGLTARGDRVHVAHPERNTSFQSNPSRLVELTLRGVLVQVDVPSLVTPRRGSRSRRTALGLIREGTRTSSAPTPTAERASGRRT